ncbi:MAG: glycosyltransferase family 4 protein [Phycisphaerales bacterium]
MACHCPIVSTKCGGPADFVREGENGYLVEIGDAEAMADRILAGCSA